MNEIFTNGVRYNNIEVVETLLQVSTFQQQLNDTHDVRSRCITDVCEHGHIEMLRFLLLDTSIKWTSDEKNLGLVRACEFGQVNIVKFLLGLGDVNTAFNFNQPIKMAVTYGQTDIVTQLIDKPSVNPLDYEYSEIHHGEIDYKYLLTAARRGNSDSLNIVLSRYIHRLDTNVVNEILSEFTRGYQMGINEQIYLIHKFKKPSGASVSRMYKLLLGVVGVNRVLAHELFMEALAKGDVECVEALLELDQIDPMFNNNQWMMKIGSHEKRIDMIKLLEKSKNVDFNEALLVACSDGLLDFVNVLVGISGVDPTALDNGPLWDACRKGYFEIVQVLVTCSFVDVSANGFEAVVVAAQNGRSEIVEFLMGLEGVEMPQEVKKIVERHLVC
ncbi:hypothetical protein HDU76_005782 [Blyttiomyces sp. JEL0837]|nr:hypothetical protein HDU76_005782 [Blyttiomyces sp. JEL0837]